MFPIYKSTGKFGNIQTNKTSFHTDYQHYTKYKNTQGMTHARQLAKNWHNKAIATFPVLANETLPFDDD